MRAVELDQLAAGGDQRLRRDAVPEVRGAADDVALDQRDVGAQGGRDRRAGVARGATADDHETRHDRQFWTRSERPHEVRPRNLIAMSRAPSRSGERSRRDRRRRPGRTPAHRSRPGPRPTPRPATARSAPATSAKTPPEVARTGGGAPDGPGWRVRVVPNLTRSSDGPRGRGALARPRPRLRRPRRPRGVAVFTVLRDRVRTHVDAGHAFARAIVNHGRAAGASIAHPHAQVLAIDFVPPAVDRGARPYGGARASTWSREIDRAGDRRSSSRERRRRSPIWCPCASTSQVLFRGHARRRRTSASSSRPTRWSTTSPSRRATHRSPRSPLLGDVPYNVVVHTAPRDHRPFHWYVEVTPRISVIAGFEQATGVLREHRAARAGRGRAARGMIR